ncbi:MAG: elongation factor 1-alpha [Candidatus Lokiarchaeota archaeon]|nr:elongation factor 1-alpha [Candidatus Lokiarchaeota archaeon]
MDEKKHINVIVIGHIDHGKSTLFGDLLIRIGAISEKEKRELEKAGELYGKDPKIFTLDTLVEERKTGNTINLTFKKIETKDKIITIIDAPGHADFIKNMITGASQADAAVLVVSGKKGEAEVGCASNGQTKEHVYLAQTLGIKQIIVVINKADLWEFSEVRFEEVKKIMSNLLKTVGYDIEHVRFIPTSGKTGDNVAEKSTKMSWYNGDALFEALKKIQFPKISNNRPLRLSIQDVYHIKGHGTIPVGKISSGTLNIGDKVLINPGSISCEIKSIENHHVSIQSAGPGSNIGFNIRGNNTKEIRRGFVVGHESNPPNVINPNIDTMRAHIIVINHPTVICSGYTPVFHLATAQTAVKFLNIESKIDHTGRVIESSPKFIKQGDHAIVKLTPMKKLCAEIYSEFPSLGRFAVRDMKQTVVVGIIKEIEKLK